MLVKIYLRITILVTIYDRLLMATLHRNKNAHRTQATTKGLQRWAVARPKAKKGTPVAKPIKEKPTYGTMFLIYLKA